MIKESGVKYIIELIEYIVFKIINNINILKYELLGYFFTDFHNFES